LKRKVHYFFTRFGKNGFWSKTVFVQKPFLEKKIKIKKNKKIQKFKKY